jgi:hypothetical protein
MRLGAEVTVSIVFGVFMAIIALLGLWQVAHYAARSLRSEYMLPSLNVADFGVAHNHRSTSFELEA